MPTENRSSNEQKMVSVPREWLSSVSLLQMSLEELQEQAAELLTRSPAQHQGEPVGYQIRSKTDRPDSQWSNWRECCDTTRAMHFHELGRFNRFGIMREIRPVYANSDSGEVERLRAEVQLLKSDLRIARDTAALGVKMLAELEALLARTLPYLSNTPDLVQHGAEDLAAEIRSASAGRPCYGPNEWGTECGQCSNCKALSASAEPSAPVESDFSKQKHDAWRRAFYGEDSAPVERDERASFELVIREKWPGIMTLRINRPGAPVDGEYELPGLEDAWQGWQARAALERKS